MWLGAIKLLGNSCALELGPERAGQGAGEAWIRFPYLVQQPRRQVLWGGRFCGALSLPSLAVPTHLLMLLSRLVDPEVLEFGTLGTQTVPTWDGMRPSCSGGRGWVQ